MVDGCATTPSGPNVGTVEVVSEASLLPQESYVLRLRPERANSPSRRLFSALVRPS